MIPEQGGILFWSVEIKPRTTSLLETATTQTLKRGDWVGTRNIGLAFIYTKAMLSLKDRSFRVIANGPPL